jgi:NADH-quinone oxidoreductase subunit I
MSDLREKNMYGLGILKGLGVAFRHFIETYVDDIRHWGKRYNTKEGVAYRSSKDVSGIFTVQYPEEKLPVPEEFRFIPFLIYEDKEGKIEYRCTSCGICAKVCPPQCIWIVRSSDPSTGRPIPDPAEFFIDIDICMNCGFCAEYCPFDAIKMDHDYELASYIRQKNNIYDKARLGKPISYYASVRPDNYEREETERREAETQRMVRKVTA